MKRIAAFSLLALAPTLLGSQEVHAFWGAPANCSTPGVPEVEIVSRQPRVSIDHSKDQAQIEGEARSLVSYAKQGWTTNGLTSANLTWQNQSTVSAYQIRDGSWCAELAKITFTVEYQDPMRVLVASRYPEGSCNYRVILAHELEHVQIYLNALNRHIPYMKDWVLQSLQAAGPGRGTTAPIAQRAAQASLDKIQTAIIERISAEFRASNAHIDTAENYNHITMLCPRW